MPWLASAAVLSRCWSIPDLAGGFLVIVMLLAISFSQALRKHSAPPIFLNMAVALVIFIIFLLNWGYFTL